MARKSTQGQVQRYQTYLFDIDEVNPTYSFDLNQGRHWPGVYSEHLCLEVQGRCLHPKKFKGRETQFHILGQRGMIPVDGEQDDCEKKPLCVGRLTIRGNRSQYLGSMPFDATFAVMQLVIAGSFRFIYLHGEAMRHGSAAIHYSAFYRDYDVDEL